jgi:hypothetical protein
MAMEREYIQAALGRWDIRMQLHHERTLTSAVTTAWGVNWDELYIARDLMQNFFDANRNCLDEVLVKRHGTDVAVMAPAPFNLERLFYLGSEKGADDVGQYGEGFKVAATCLLRDHAVTPIAVSGRDVVCLRVADRAIADTQLYPVEYDFYRSDREVLGTILLLPGCSGKLTNALTQGLTHFFYDSNPLLGPKRWSDRTGAFSIYDATNNRGHVFYRKLKRGEIDGIPVVLVIDKEYQAIERKISKDRDRNAFGDEVMKLFYNHFARYGLKWEDTGQRVIVEAARSSWEKGHPLLNEIAESRRYNSVWPATMAREVFGDRYYARSSRPSEAERLEIDRLERQWRDAGKIALATYFQKFGVVSAQDELRRIREKAVEEEKTKTLRMPTTAERDSIRLLSQVLRELAPEVMAIFAKRNTSYTVAKTEAVLGALKAGQGYRSYEVFLAASLFEADFSEALATFLHEHAHIFGYDGSRGFTDALTGLLETVLRHRRDLDPYEQGWEQVRAAIRRERQERSGEGETDGMKEWLSALSETDLRQLMEQLPMTVLRKLRRHRP